jgi:hypothetical protein
VTLLAHHAGEALILTAALAGGLPGSLLLMRAAIVDLARRRGRRRR